MLFKYFIELKNRALVIFLTWISLLIAFLTYKENLLYLIIQPNFEVLNFSHFIFTNINEIWLVYLDLSQFLTNQLSFFFLFYQFLLFLTPALCDSENKAVKLTAFICLIFWLTASICYSYYLIPLLLLYLLHFNSILTIPVDFHFEAKIYEFFSFYIGFYYLFLLICFLLVFFNFLFLAKGVANTKKTRKLYLYMLSWFTIICFDFNFQIFLCVFFVLIFELKVILSLLYFTLKY